MIYEWRFLNPAFLALLPWPLVWLAWHRWRSGKRHPTLVYSDVSLLGGIQPTFKQRVLRLMPWVRVLVLMLGIIALARPQYGSIERHVNSMGLDIALVIDVSGSMQAQDFKPNRLEAAKAVVKKFIEGRPNDRISIIIFAEDAAVLSPPTFDSEAAKLFVDNIHDQIIPNTRTAIGMGLALGVDKLKDSKAKSKVLVLLTDGDNNAGVIQPLQAAEAAKALKIRTYTIGVGTDGETVIPQQTPLGPVMQRVTFTIDEDTLTKIAEMTGGKYFRAKEERALARIYNEIDHLEKTEIEATNYANFDERFMWLWGPALALVLLEFLLRAFWLVRLP